MNNTETVLAALTLNTFQGRAPITLGELARRSNLSPAAVRRILSEVDGWSAVRRTAGARRPWLYRASPARVAAF